jgi:hypothetical protein
MASDAEIIVKLRRALDVLKDKYVAEMGGWVLVDFMGAASDENHWMRLIFEAEELSQPYLDATMPTKEADDAAPR